jgi:hypothetical protein
MTSAHKVRAFCHRALSYGLTAVVGCSAGLVTAVACATGEDSDPCEIDAIEVVEPLAGHYQIYVSEPPEGWVWDWDWGTPYPSLADADVYVEGNLVTMTWTEAEVEHQIVWQIESYEWKNLWN